MSTKTLTAFLMALALSVALLSVQYSTAQTPGVAVHTLRKPPAKNQAVIDALLLLLTNLQEELTLVNTVPDGEVLEDASGVQHPLDAALRTQIADDIAEVGTMIANLQ